MMRRTLLLCSGLALVLAACSDNNAATNATADAGNMAATAGDRIEDTTAAAVGTVTAPTVNTAEAYVTQAAIGDMYEIESSRLALQKSQSAAVKKFAQQMIDDHTATTAALKAAIGQAGLQLAPPTQLDARRQGMLDNLKNLSGAAFDTAYLDQQTAAHSEALGVQRSYADDGENAVLKKLAADTAPKIEHHGQMVRELDSSGADDTD